MLKKYVLPIIFFIIIWPWRLTWRLRFDEPEELKKALKEKRPFILAHWHGDELVLLWTVRYLRAATMVSTSKDGEIMNTLFHLFGGKTSRGSSTRGAVGGLKGLLRLVKTGRNPSIAVDGPKGPYHKVKPGVFELSRILHLPIYVAGVSCSSCFRFEKAWNKTYIPKPFADVLVTWQGPYSVIRKDQDPRDESLALELALKLDGAEHQARKLIAPPKS